MRTGASWMNYCRPLIQFNGNGEIIGGNNKTIGEYTPRYWYTVTIHYSRSPQEIEMQYYLDGEYLDTIVISSYNTNEEDSLNYLELVSQEGSVFFDDIKVYTACDTGSPPIPPHSISVQRTENENALLNWIDDSINEEGFQIERSVISNSSGFEILATVNENENSYKDSSVTSGIDYWYRVRAYNPNGYSNYSTPVFFSFNAPTLHVDKSTFAFSTTHESMEELQETLRLGNENEGFFSWVIEEDSTWLSLAPALGSSNGETVDIILTVQTGNLDTGTHEANIKIHSPSATNSPLLIKTTLIVYPKPSPKLPVIDEIVSLEIHDGNAYGGKGNSDNIIQVGEEITLDIDLTNTGEGTAYNLIGELRVRSADVDACTLNDYRKIVSVLKPNQVISLDGFNFSVDKMPQGEALDFILDLRYEDETGTLNFHLINFLLDVYELERAITVTNPSENYVVNIGDTGRINWINQAAGNNVKIQLFNSEGFVKTLTFNTDNDGYFEWLVKDLSPRNDYYIRISSLDFRDILGYSPVFAINFPKNLNSPPKYSRQ